MERGGSYHQHSHHHHQMQQFQQRMRDQQRSKAKSTENETSALRVGPKRPIAGIGNPNSPMLKYLKIRVRISYPKLWCSHNSQVMPHFRFEACFTFRYRSLTKAPAFCLTRHSKRPCLLHGNCWGENSKVPIFFASPLWDSALEIRPNVHEIPLGRVKNKKEKARTWASEHLWAQPNK